MNNKESIRYFEMMGYHMNLVAAHLKLIHEVATLRAIIMRTLDDDRAVSDKAHDALYEIAQQTKERTEEVRAKMAADDLPE